MRERGGEMNGRPSISVIIVNYNGVGLLDECLGSLREQSCRDFEIVLVDNGSSDSSVDFVQRNYSDVILVANKENLGYGGGNNSGIRAAGGRYIAVLNNDTKADALWLERLLEAAEKDSEAGMFASKILNYYSPDVIDNTGLMIYRDGIARGRGRLEKDEGQYDVRDEVFFPSGCAGFYRREVFDEIGLYDEDFFLYLDDVDVGLRARLAGWRCVYVPDAVVYHKYSASTEPYSPLKAFLVERNRIWIVVKYFSAGMACKSLYYSLLRYAYQFYAALSRKGASGRLVKSSSLASVAWLLVRAYAAACAGAGKMLRRRRGMKAFTKLGGRQLSELFDRFSITARELALKD